MRITSKKFYSRGLFVFDIVNAPYGCSTWPALWLTDPSNWPTNGEIDVLEAVNGATTGNLMALHTSKGCKMDQKREETGKVITKDCYSGTNTNTGCGVQGPQETYGQALNANGGGVYAMEWRSEGSACGSSHGQTSLPISPRESHQTHHPGEQLSLIFPTPTAISARISETRVLSRASISVDIGLGTLWCIAPLMDVQDSVLTLSPTTQQRSRRLFDDGTVGRYISLHNSRWGAKRAYS